MPSNESLKAYYDREEWFEGGEIGGYQNYDQQTAWSIDAIKPVLESFKGAQGLSVLDIGCGYGTHLELASNLGWKCFGVEVSDHARNIARKRLEGKAHIVETVADMIPHEFDLVLMLDVIEHFPSPYTVFYRLFSIGAITPKTRIVISTPNAGSIEARRNPSKWQFRHPPSHLVYYSAETLVFLLERLHFAHVNVQGTHSLRLPNCEEGEISGCSGLVATATGSDFTEFMRERYVPGTWSKLAEYEHSPRYAFAKSYVAGKRVLDFGCGTGYGAAVLAESAVSVTGLDIDQPAITWATATHHSQKLNFYRSTDLGVSLPSGSFDVVTCFEMIEHVDYETQVAVIASIERLLCDEGLLIISTPNPETTKLYGANPYHLREMTLPEFHDLLGQHFPHICTVEQRVRNSITFDVVSDRNASTLHLPMVGKAKAIPLAFVVLCSKRPICTTESLVFFDDEFDLIKDYLDQEKKQNEERFDAYLDRERLGERNLLVTEQGTTVTNQNQEIILLRQVLEVKEAALAKQAQELNRLNEAVRVKEVAVSEQAQEINRLNDAVRAKEVAVSEQAQEINRLNEAVRAKEVAVSEQAQEINRLNQAVGAKEAALAKQAQELNRLNEAVRAKEVAVSEQAQEIRRLNQTVGAKEAALAKQAQELNQLNEAFAAKEIEVSDQAKEVIRLFHLLSDYRDTFLIQKDVVKKHVQEVDRLNGIIRDIESATVIQTQEIKRVNRAYEAKELVVSAQAEEITRLGQAVAAKGVAVLEYAQEIETLRRDIESKIAAMAEIKQAYSKISKSKWNRLGEAIKSRPVSVQSSKTILYLLASLLVPHSLRAKIYPAVSRYRQYRLKQVDFSNNADRSNIFKSYVVKQPTILNEKRPRVVHVIANFCTGGSSRLIIDLIEHLGQHYEQSVITSYIPNPPDYLNLEIKELRFPNDEHPFIEHFKRLEPGLIHIHYWGECDEQWYAKSITAAERLGIPVIENINTPVAPYYSPAIRYYVHVSDYVRREFGKEDPAHLTVYPGSDFSHFTRGKNEHSTENCIGMVYRLEPDKLNEESILPFICAVRKRPNTKVLIVGGGSLLEAYIRTVTEAGVVENFEFTDYVSYTELPEYYRRMTVFVAPVWKESFGQVSPFAMNMKIPVCGYDVGAISEIVGDPNLLAPVANVERLAEIVLRLLDSPSERRSIGEYQHRRARDVFSIHAMISAYRKIYRQITGV